MTMSAAIMANLEARGLDVELADRLGFGSIVRAGTEYLVIPCHRDGRIHRRKMRTLSGEKKFQQEGDGPIPWNEDVLRDDGLSAQPLIITEGELDAMAAIQCGFTRTVSVPDGAPQEAAKGDPFEAKRYAWLNDVRPWIGRDRVSEIILAVDGDDPGKALQQDLSVMLGRFRCKFVTYPKARDGRRMKDLNEVLMEYGAKGIVKTIQGAQFIQCEGVYRMSDLPDLPPVAAYEAGFEQLDRNYRVRLGDFCVVTGIPSHGKSAFVNDFFCRLVSRHGFRIAWASFEQDPQRDHRRNLRAWYIQGERAKARERGDVFTKVERDPLTGEEIQEADDWIDSHHRFVIPSEDEDITLEWMVERMEQAVIQHDCQIIVIDPWNELDHMRERDETETEYVGRAIKRFKRFAKAFQVHVVVVAHPTKIRKDENGKTPMPTLYDIAGSANWNNKADVGLIVHRETDDDSLIKVAKSRYHSQIGVPGTVRMQFGKESLRFIETERVS